MTEEDFPRFDRVFKRLVGLFRLRLQGDALTELSRSYFKVLEAADLEQVVAAGRVCIATRRQFPKPVDWLQALPIPAPANGQKDLRVLTDAEAREWHRAEQLRWEDDPCGCLHCQAAEVEKPLRFVPEDLADGCDLFVQDPLRNRAVIAGHWAHGVELVRWYAARAAFYDAFYRHVGRRAMPALAIVRSREPGEEG